MRHYQEKRHYRRSLFGKYHIRNRLIQAKNLASINLPIVSSVYLSQSRKAIVQFDRSLTLEHPL
jgi:hypothetical protein